MSRVIDERVSYKKTGQLNKHAIDIFTLEEESDGAAEELRQRKRKENATEGDQTAHLYCNKEICEILNPRRKSVKRGQEKEGESSNERKGSRRLKVRGLEGERERRG